MNEQHFIQVTIQSGRLVENAEGGFDKIIDATAKDDVFHTDSEAQSNSLSDQLVQSLNEILE